MRIISSRWAPHRLTDVQKWYRYELASIHLDRYRNDGNVFLQRIIAIVEK